VKRRRIAGAGLALAVAAVSAGAGYAAFRAVASNDGNSFAAGSVALADNDAGTAMFTTLTSARAGDSETSCITVRSDGSLPSSVRLYGAVAGALASHLTLTVTRGSDGAPGFDDCTGFDPDDPDYVGQGGGVLYSGTLSSFPSTWAAGIADLAEAGGSEVWTDGEVHVYRLEVRAGTSTAAEGLSATASFTWEARSQ